MKVSHETYTLKNGMQILLINTKNSYSVDISASSRWGAALETAKNQGITHFVEHMALTATKKYPKKKEFNEVLESNGGTSDASTSNEFVTFSLNLPYKNLAFGMDLIHEILYNGTFNSDYVEKERTIILDEISKYENDVGYRASRYIESNLFNKRSSYTLDIAGTRDAVKSFTKRQLIYHYQKINAPGNLLLTISGNFDKDKVKELIDEYFAKIRGSKNKLNFPDEDISRGRILVKNDKKSDLILHSTLFPSKDGISLTTYDSILIFLIKQILAGSTSSRLNKRLREEEGLLYHIGAAQMIFYKFSGFEIYFEVPPHLYKRTFGILLEELSRFYEKGVSEKELKHFREFQINRNLIEFDLFRRNAIRIRNAIFYDKDVYSVEEINKTIKKLTAKEINAYIKLIFNLKKASHVAYGNTTEDTQRAMQEIIRN